ncbi:nuclear transport factor 2 family protein [Lactobacillus crispatus]|uniref:Nuclear transport factor 2 family protein n=2 Tax=Lactobacillus crispatus TaxID=47770 RepID=A0AAW6XM08_9LACO|nr:nuclear transport factor 2 family protein [Lactobacillus crispatus]MDK6503232.1 nuclear transport factor 2 family protein [Lactobacillus crispatus]PLA29567.1 SnoaL-like polyketide cyclase [Lactobacillus crispatus]
MSKKQIIRDYFQAWLKPNIEVIKSIFDKNATYSECYGPIYRNKKEIISWFEKWNKQGKVIAWPIEKILINENTCIVEWHFKCNYQKKISEFDGVSVIDFNDQNKIISVKEYQSKSQHYYPYSK